MMSPDKALNYLKELRNDLENGWIDIYEPECAPGYLSFWGDGMVDYRYSPISVILALPEREVMK